MKSLPAMSPLSACAALFSVGLAAALVLTPSSAAPPAARVATPAEATAFEKQVRPFLASQCLSCHGSSAQMGGVRLDTRDGLLATVTPGDPARSRLIAALHYTGKVKMPPSGKRPETEIAPLVAWVKAGAPYPASAPKAGWGSGKTHWAFKPVVRPAVPAAPGNTAASPVDRFLLRQLQAKGLTFAPPADRRTLIRRATLDLTGLPPTVADVNAFLADPSPRAYEKVVDRLLASPQYGERWARHWLDVARYADSNGLDENIAFGNAWRYRDWVVDSLNRDTPYNTFVMEQIAGDLMDSGGDDELAARRVMATGFLSLGPKVLAEPDKPKMVMDIVDEQIDVTTKAVLGLTVSCARCHDHKFDPIPTRDYYALAGIFRSTKTMRTLNTVAQINQRTLTTKAMLAAQAAHRDLMVPLEAAVTDAKAKADGALLASLRADAPRYRAVGWELSRASVALFTRGDAVKDAPGRLVLNAADYARGNAVRDTGSYGSKETPVLITDTPPVSAEWDVTVPKAGWYQLEIRYAAEESRPFALHINSKEVRSDAGGSITGKWNLEGQRWEAQGVYELAAGVNRINLERMSGPIPHISRLQLIPAPAPSVASADRRPSANGTRELAEKLAKQHDLAAPVLLRWAEYLTRFPTPDEAARETGTPAVLESLCALPPDPVPFYPETERATFDKARMARDEMAKKMPQPLSVIAVEEGTPEDVRVHLRGDTQTLGDPAPRGYLTTFKVPGTAALDPKTSGRLGLARWMTAAQNPLTARVQVNRVWSHLFGEGLVRTPDNFGLRGEAPTDPALLDYLASTFAREDGWSQKRLIRRLMLSQAYRQASSATSAQAKIAALRDPDNRLWWRQNRRRLEAEQLRDGLLYVSGELDLTRGGTLLTSKDGDYVTNDQSADKAQYDASRRSLYLPVIRNSLYDLFQVFDFGDGATVTAHRASTTVAPQSLYLMNSPLMLTASDKYAAHLLKGAGPNQGRIRRAYEEALSRPATAAEITRVNAFLTRYEKALAAEEPNANKRRARAWQAFAQALLSSNEFLYVN